MKNKFSIILSLLLALGTSSYSIPLKTKYNDIKNPKDAILYLKYLKAKRGNSLIKSDSSVLKQIEYDTRVFESFCGDSSITKIITDKSCNSEKNAAYRCLEYLKNKKGFANKLESIEKTDNDNEKSELYLEAIDNIISLIQIQDKIDFINIESISLAIDNMSKMNGFNKEEINQKFSKLKKLYKNGFPNLFGGDYQEIERAKEVIALQREILMSNPVIDVDNIIVGRYNIGKNARVVNCSALGTQSNNWSNQTSTPTSGYDSEIALMSNLKGDVQTKRIFKPTNTSCTADFKLHFNGQKMMFTMVEPGDHHWQLYEIGIDGKNFKQLTNNRGEHLDFFDGCYLPNGKIIAASNIGGQGVPCVSGSDQVGNLCLYDPEKDNLRRLTFDQDANWHPVMMHNGRVMYVRWEYTDLTHYFSRMVMHMNPDGTEQRSLYGSGSVFPNSIFDIQPLPNHPSSFVGIISGHHGVVRSGRMIIFDPAKNRKEEKGMIQELPFRNRPIIPIVKDELVNGVYPQFIKPIPLSNDYFIVTAKLSPNSLWGLYLIDVFDNLTLIAEYENEGLIYGIPLKQTPVPPIIPEKVNLNSHEATVFIQDLYEGEGLKGVKRGTVKELRVFAYEYAYLNTQSDHTAQGIQSGWDIKRLLGTVPVEEDGSVIFNIPANTPISLQPLDSEGRAIQWMRSWLTGMPGETVSCVGCHEDMNQIPVPKKVIASAKKPNSLKQPEGGIRSFTFDYEVQPILDRNCVSCHNGDGNKADLRGGKKDENGYGTSYLAIHPYIHRQGPEAGMKVLFPYEYHASNSALVRLLKNGHYGVSLDDDEWRTLYNWIDFNAPDKGRFNANPWSGVDQKERRIRLNKEYSNGIYVDWEKELRDYADYLKNISREPKKRDYKEPSFKNVKIKGFPFDAHEKYESGKKSNNELEKKVIEIAPGESITLVRIPAGSFIMGKNQANTNYSPAHKNQVKKAFWISEKEITNAQLRVFVASHDSRFMDQQWKDHVSEGYPANLPEQPASRVSFEEAQEFCDKASEKLSLNIMLPTEVQWEWACRAGTDSDFWYGDINSDFSDKENLADKQTTKLAVIGVDPQPMSHNNGWYKYYNFIPKIESVDDGNMLVANPGSYQANPFGLYDMHGNVAEWTRSDYFPYPYKEKNQGNGDMKVVRGGSWKEHPKYSSSVYRRAFYPNQKPFNVGFRIVIED